MDENDAGPAGCFANMNRQASMFEVMNLGCEIFPESNRGQFHLESEYLAHWAVVE